MYRWKALSLNLLVTLFPAAGSCRQLYLTVIPREVVVHHLLAAVPKMSIVRTHPPKYFTDTRRMQILLLPRCVTSACHREGNCGTYNRQILRPVSWKYCTDKDRARGRPGCILPICMYTQAQVNMVQVFYFYS